MSQPSGAKRKQLQQNTYDQFADRYAESLKQSSRETFSFNHDLVIPRLLESVGALAGLRVLDAGCGEGIVARLLAARGAKVTAMDIAPRLIELARAQNPEQAIAFQVRDLSLPLPEYKNAFDLVVSNLVLNDVPDYQGFISTLGSVTKPRGRMVLSMNNPYSALIREKVQSYFDSDQAILYNMAREGIAVYYFHRTFEEYMTAFRDAGFLLRHLVDVRVKEDIAANLPQRNRELPYFDMYPRFPFFLILDLGKLV
jgi:2-polyprenyl-3-methyl-5-hydroxy-6-metoxy-1,4-benzoquinol methylase